VVTFGCRLSAYESEVMRERAEAALAARRAAEIGAMRTAVVERPGCGRTERYLPVAIEGGRTGELRAVHIVAAHPHGLEADAVRDAA
jgi:tRNA A37 methylthiotransferase MiaB